MLHHVPGGAADIARLHPHRSESRRGGLLLVLLVLSCVAGCSAGPRRQLHALSGDEFTLFPQERRAPPPSDCTGSTEQRFACLAKQANGMSEELGIAGGFAVVTADGDISAFARGDALNQGAHVIDENTRFPVGSVTKMFLGAAAVSLSLEGALDLRQPLAGYLPELSASGGVGQATLHQLLTHTSGLGNPPQCEEPQDDLADELARHGHKPLWSPPGLLFNYSNVGYSFAALALERVTGKPFEQIGNTSNPVVFAAGFRALSTLLSLPPDWQPPPGPAHALSAYAGVYRDEAGTLGTLRVSLEEGSLVIDYLDGPPPLLPPGFRFVFLPGDERAQYVVTPVGVGRRVVASASP